MSLVALVSAKHSPGATTSALALATARVAGGPALVAELDPSGGDLAARLGLPLDPGLVSLAAASRRGLTADVLAPHAQALPSGVRLLVGPTAPEQAMAALAEFGSRLGPALGAAEGTVFADCGRWAPSSPATDVLRAAEVVLVVTRPSLEGVEHVRTRIDALKTVARHLALLIVGERPYGPEEVGTALRLDVAGVLEDDARSVAALGRVDGGALRRLALVRSARAVVEAVVPTPVGAAS